MSSSHKNTFRCVACSVLDGCLPSFLTIREVYQHSLHVHRVTLEAAVLASTMLPDKLAMYECKLCTQDKEIYLCDTIVKAHLESHSAFFLKRWKEYVKVKCRVCEIVIECDGMEEHMDKIHPSELFAGVKDLEEKDISEINANQDSDGQAISDPEEKNTLSSDNVKSPLDMLIDMGMVETLEVASEQMDYSYLTNINTEPSETVLNNPIDEVYNLKENNSESVEKIVSNYPSKVKFMSSYAFFMKHEKLELKKKDPKGKINSKLINEKWANLSQLERKVYSDMASEYKSTGNNPFPLPKVKVKSEPKSKPKVNESKCPAAKEIILTNREFVDKFEDISIKTEIVAEKNKKLLELISVKKLSILKNSHEMQKRNDSEADYRSRFQKLSALHEKCFK